MGDSGQDEYWFAGGDGMDTIIDTAGYDILKFMAYPAHGPAWQMFWFVRRDNDLQIYVGGVNSGDSVTIKDYYGSGGNGRIERIIAGDWRIEGDSIEQLCAAMAAFAPPEETGIEFHPELYPLLSQYWLVTLN